MDLAVVAIGTNFEASVLITMHCKALGVPLVCAKALNSMQEQVLTRVGADRVVKPEEDMGQRLAEHLTGERVVDFVNLPPGFVLRRIPVPGSWDGSSLADLRLLGDRRLCLVQIVRRREGEGERRKEPLPHGETVLHAGDEVDAIGPVDVLDGIARDAKKP
jgi:trk system potassium uptake protein TrkA